MAEQTTGWASTKPGRNKYHFYSEGESLCSYQRQPGPLHFADGATLLVEQKCEACNHPRHKNVRAIMRRKEAPPG